ncbi:MAG: choice-of-anchor D domain-containing protein [Chloroflexota bacterium]
MLVTRRLAASVGMLAVLASLAVPREAHAASIRQVPGDYPTIGAALAASSAGDTVLVAPGTYAENLTVPSGVTLESSGGPSVTAVDAGPTAPGAVIESGATMHGFTLENGGGGYGDVGGAKVYGTLDGNVLTNNGGCYFASAALLMGGTISNNSFHDNVAGCSSVPVVGGTGTVVGNVFDEHGDVFFLNSQSPTIERNVFRGDPRITMYNVSNPVIRDNLFLVATTALQWLVPLGAPGPTVVNNTFVATAGIGPLVKADGFDSSTVFANNVLVGHDGTTLMECTSTFDSVPPVVQSNDLWRPGGGGLAGPCADAVGTAGNVSVDPLFASAANDDFHLRADSPLIDAGVNGIAMAPDFDGDARPLDGDEDGIAIVDMGFDESTDPLAVGPGDLFFGAVPLARTTTSNVTLTNLGSSSLSITTVVLGGPAAVDYSITGQTCAGVTLAVGHSCTIPVAFTPSVLAKRDATVTVTGPGLVGTRTILLVGAGVDPIAVTPPSFTFPAVTVGDAGAPGTITVANSGGAAATISSITVTGDAGDVAIGAQTCTAAPVAQDATCSVPFTWRPKASGNRAASIVVDGPAPVGTRSVSISGAASPAASGVGWSTPRTAGPAHTWNGGGALARTVQSGTQRLHLEYSTDRVSGRWATDTGPKVGVYYTRSTSGTTWSTPKRLNPTTEHATVSGLAASGAKVYAMWVSQTKYVHYSPTAKRILYVRVNTNHGSSTSWRSRVRLSSTTGRVDYPSIAAAGTKDAHIAYTNGNTGTVFVRSSRDGGLTWSNKSMGSTSIALSDGRTGFPTIAAAGSTVAVCWLSDTFGTVRCRVSTNRGVSWGSATTVGSGATGYFSVAVRGTRIAVAWPTETAVVIRQLRGGTWQSPRAIENGAGAAPSGVNVLLQDPNRIRVSYVEGESGGDFTSVRAVESADGGATYFAAETASTAGDAHWRNDWPSVIWPTASTRYVVWNGWTPNTNNYRLYFTRGSGTPIAPTFASTAWNPSSRRLTIPALSPFAVAGDPMRRHLAPQFR